MTIIKTALKSIIVFGNGQIDVTVISTGIGIDKLSFRWDYLHLFSTNTFWKGINPLLPLPSYG